MYDGKPLADEPLADEPITICELLDALKKLKNQTTGSDDGLVAEMLMTGHADLLRVLAEFFSEVLNGVSEPPEEWKMKK